MVCVRTLQLSTLILLQVCVNGLSQHLLAAALDVTLDPEVEDNSTRHLVAALGSNLILPCYFDQDSDRDMTNCYWNVNEDLVELGNRYRLNGNSTAGDCSLSITSFRLSDAGSWHCGLPRTDSRPAIKTGYVELTKDPKLGLSWRSSLRERQLYAGVSVRLLCSGELAGTTSCYWLHKRHNSSVEEYPDFANLQDSTSPLPFNGKSSSILSDCSLQLVNVSVHHEGIWQCSREKGNASRVYDAIHLFVQVPVSHVQAWYAANHQSDGKVRHVDGHHRLPVNESANTTLHCSAAGTPPPQFRWDEWRDRRWWPLSHQQNVTLPANAVGNYSCVARNELWDRVNVTLRSHYVIIGIPDADGDTEVMIDVRNMDDSSATASGYGTVIAVSAALVLIAVALVIGMLFQRKRGGVTLQQLHH